MFPVRGIRRLDKARYRAAGRQEKKEILDEVVHVKQQRQQSERAHGAVHCVAVVDWRANMSSRVWARHMGWFLSMDQIARPIAETIGAGLTAVRPKES